MKTTELDERERRRRLVAELRADNLERNAALQRDIDAAVFTRKIPRVMDRERAEIAAAEAERAVYREAQHRERKTASASPTAASHADWEAWLRARLDEERAFVLECVGTALGEALRKERAAAKRELGDEVKRLRVEITAADETIAELRRTIDAGKRSGEVIDITPIARRN